GVAGAILGLGRSLRRPGLGAGIAGAGSAWGALAGGETMDFGASGLPNSAGAGTASGPAGFAAGPTGRGRAFGAVGGGEALEFGAPGRSDGAGGFGRIFGPLGLGAVVPRLGAIGG